MAPIKLLGILLLLVICIKSGQAGKKRKGKTIKIHVPYYVKHIHHYKKVLVPKVQVVKHEHHHKKQHDHHHHHHDHDHHEHHGYDKAGYVEEPYETFYEDEEPPKSYGSGRHGRGRGKGGYRASGSEQYQGWRDIDGTEYRGEDSMEDEEYSDAPGPAEIVHSAPSHRFRSKSQNLVGPVYRTRGRPRDRYDRSDYLPESSVVAEVVALPSKPVLPPVPLKRVLTRITATET